MSIVVGHGRPDFSSTYKQPEALCPRCDGKGYTRKTAPVIKDKVTTAMGSGCPECKGTTRSDT